MDGLCDLVMLFMCLAECHCNLRRNTEAYGAGTVKKWKERRTLSELEKKLKAGIGRVQLMLGVKAEPGGKRN